MKIQVLIIYHTVYGDAVILLNYQLGYYRRGGEHRRKKVNGSIWKEISDSDSEIRKTVPI